jgi:hypothetical protein
VSTNSFRKEINHHLYKEIKCWPPIFCCLIYGERIKDLNLASKKKGWVDGLKERLIEGACLAQNL